MAQVAIANDANMNICTLTAVGDLTAAANEYFGSNPYDIQDKNVLDGQVVGYPDAYSWNLTTHSLDVDIVKARTDRMNQFKILRDKKWCDMGVAMHVNDVIIGLFTGTEKTTLESCRDMIGVEGPILDGKNTIAELVAYLPSYLV